LACLVSPPLSPPPVRVWASHPIVADVIASTFHLSPFPVALSSWPSSQIPWYVIKNLSSPDLLKPLFHVYYAVVAAIRLILHCVT
jgi:hypothetical protein